MGDAQAVALQEWAYAWGGGVWVSRLFSHVDRGISHYRSQRGGAFQTRCKPGLRLTVVLGGREHEKGAAWTCLLTAGCSATGEAEVVGDDVGGWFWLPPQDQWAGWAREALEKNRLALA